MLDLMNVLVKQNVCQKHDFYSDMVQVLSAFHCMLIVFSENGLYVSINLKFIPV